MATVKKPAAKKAAKPMKPAVKKTPLDKLEASADKVTKKIDKAVATAKAVKAAVKPVTAVLRKTAESVEKKSGDKKTAASLKSTADKLDSAAGLKKPVIKKAAPAKKPVVVKKAAKKVSKVDKLMKVPAPAPLTAGQQSAVSVATAALKMRQQQFADSNSRPATQAVEQAPVEKFQRPAPSPVSNDGLSFKERLRQAESRRVDGQQAFLNRLQAAQRS